MFKLDDNLLYELGLGRLPAAQKNKLLSRIYEVLEARVGVRVAKLMSNRQLEEFEAFIDNGDEGAALAWLEREFPLYRQIVSEELQQVKETLRRRFSNG